MKAAVLKSFGSPMTIESVPDPMIGTGEVIVDVAAAPVLSYLNEVLSGQRQYLLTLPAVPGSSAVGRVRATGPDATHLKPGDWVFCNSMVRSRDDVLSPDVTLQGLSARGEGGLRLQQHFRHGSYAQSMMLPTENAVRIGTIEEADAPYWCALGGYLVPYGGWLAAGLRAGETVAVNGATGGFGSCAVAVALAMGAGRVVATGRNQASLDDLARRFGQRVRTVRMSGDEVVDRTAIQQTAGDPIDCVLDLLPPAADPSWVRAAVMAVRPYGRVALMGGVGMQNDATLDLPYRWIMRSCITIHGMWMYPPEAPTWILGLVRAGLLDLRQFTVTSFDLERANEAVAHAAENAGPFRLTVIRP